jgi:carbon-monoxide dehydrogenase medium subunit
MAPIPHGDRVKPPPFVYHAPRTIEDAVAILAQVAPEDGRVIAGGQTLVPAMAMRLARPGHLVDINRVDGLDRLAVVDGALHIGACVRHAAIGAAAAPGPLGRLLGLVQRHIAHPPIRARGTYCGSLANADAASEWCLVAVALDGWVDLRSAGGARRLPVDDLLLGYMTTALEPDELIVAAGLKLLPEDTRVGFYEFARRAGDFAQVMALAGFAVRDGVIAEPRIALGALESRPRRIEAAERMLAGRRPGPDVFRAAAEAAGAALRADDDGDEQDKRALAAAAVLRALNDAV